MGGPYSIMRYSGNRLIDPLHPPLLQCIEEIMEKDQAEQDGKNSHSDSSDEKSEGEENVHPKPPKRKRAKQSGNGSKPGKVCFVSTHHVDYLPAFLCPSMCVVCE